MLKGHTPGVLHTGSLLLVPPEHTKVIEVLRGAKAMGWTISVDVNLRPKLAADLAAYVAAVKEVAQLADWIKASDEDLELLGVHAPSRAKGPEIAQLFRQHGTSRIALTFGGEGAWLEVDGASADADVPPTTVVDTVGAGDTFWGNCLGDWVLNADGKGRVSQTLKEAMQAAAINCSRAVANHPPTRKRKRCSDIPRPESSGLIFELATGHDCRDHRRTHRLSAGQRFGCGSTVFFGFLGLFVRFLLTFGHGESLFWGVMVRVSLTVATPYRGFSF